MGIFINPEDNFYILKDEKNGVNVTFPYIKKDGYYNWQYPLMSGLPNITGNKLNEFVIHEQLNNKSNGEVENWISVYRYENKQVSKVGSVKINKYKPNVTENDTVRLFKNSPAISFFDGYPDKVINLQFYDVTILFINGQKIGNTQAQVKLLSVLMKIGN